MNRSAFWSIIDTASARARGNRVRFLAALEGNLRTLPRAELVGFQRELDARMDESLTWALWGAAYLLEDGCSDDGFAYFRALLIANGRAAFESAVKEPDGLAALKLKYRGENGLELEELLSLPDRAFRGAKYGDRIPRGKLKARPAGRKWRDDDLPAMLPRLAKKVGARRRKDCPLVPGQVFRLPLPNLPGAFAHFKVVDKRAFPEWGRCVVVRLLDWWSPSAPADWSRVKRLNLRSANPYTVNTWYHCSVVFGWDEPGWDRASVETVGAAELSSDEEEQGRAAHRFDHLWPELALDAEGSREQDRWPERGEVDAAIGKLSTAELGARAGDLAKRFGGVVRRHRVFVELANRIATSEGDYSRSLAIARIGELACAGCWGSRAQQVRALYALKRFQEAELAFGAYRQRVPQAVLRTIPGTVEQFVKKLWG